jgi:membrane protease YdiL (CAAX protease family)
VKIKSTFGAPALAAGVFLLLFTSNYIDAALLRAQDNIYLSIIVLQLLVFLIPSFFYSKLRGEGFLSKLRLRFFEPDKIIFILLASAALILGSLIMSTALSSLGLTANQFSLYENYITPGVDGISDYLYVALAFAVLPAVCEEFLFRSVILAEYEQSGIFCAVTLSSALFAMLHFSFSKFPIFLFCGVVLAVITYITRSVLAAMAAHCIYNLFGLFGQAYVNRAVSHLQNYVLLQFALIGIFLFVLIFVFGEADRIYHNYAIQNKPSDYVITDIRLKNKKTSLFFEAVLSPAFLACFLLFLIITEFT